MLKLISFERLSKLPSGWDNIVARNSSTVTGGDPEREGLAVEVRVTLPVLSPVPRHRDPVVAPGALDGHSNHLASSRNIRNQHQVEVGVPIYSEPYPAFLHTRNPTIQTHKTECEKMKHVAVNDLWHCLFDKNYLYVLPSERYRNDSGLIFRDVQESRLCQVEVLARGIAPPTIIIRQCIVRRAEVGDRNGDGAREAPLGVTTALELVTRTAARALVEHYSTQRCSLCTVPLAVHVPVPTRSPCRRHNEARQLLYIELLAVALVLLLVYIVTNSIDTLRFTYPLCPKCQPRRRT